MVRPISAFEEWEWQDPDDTDEPRTTWILRLLPSKVMAYILELIADAMPAEDAELLAAMSKGRGKGKKKQDKAAEEAQAKAALKMAKNWSLRAYEICRWGLAGWRDFGDLKFETVSSGKFGKPINVVSDRCLDAIPVVYLAKLATEIIAGNSPTEDEAKN